MSRPAVPRRISPSAGRRVVNDPPDRPEAHSATRRTAGRAAVAPKAQGPAARGAAGRPGLRQRGFTLIEVLVALGIVAIALTAGLQATAALTNNAGRQVDVLLAHVCAENELAKVRLARQMPGVGETAAECEQGGRSYAVALTVAPTPNPNFRRLDAQVRDGGTNILRLSTVVGRY